jgi:hypothetical protein
MRCDNKINTTLLIVSVLKFVNMFQSLNKKIFEEFKKLLKFCVDIYEIIIMPRCFYTYVALRI